MSDTITLVLRVEGETTVEVDRAEYEEAKADGEVDEFLDAYLSEIEGDNTVVEPGGRAYNPHDEPHGPTAAHVVDSALAGPWVAVLYDNDGEICDSTDLFVEGDNPEMAVVRGTAAPENGLMPGSCRSGDVLYRIDYFDSAEDLADRWKQAQTVATALNRAAVVE